jgi:hypothetical protein
MITRADYMAANHGDRDEAMKAHRAYYAQFVNESTISTVVAWIGADRLLASTDPHLNDIPLGEWEPLCGFRQRGMDIAWFHGASLPISNRFAEAGDYATAAGLGCIAKEAARIWIERQQA